MIVDLARGVPLQTEAARRGLVLKRHGNELIGPCPQCGGTDRFAINTTKRLWLCRRCDRGGDVVDLVRFLDGCDFRAAIRTLAGLDIKLTKGQLEEIPQIDPRPIGIVNQTEIDHQNSRWALKLWDDATLIAGTPAEKYLRGRGLRDLPGETVLRFHASCPFGKARNPCLLALYRDIVTDERRAIGRTALSAVGVKLGRMSLGQVKNSAIKVDDDANVGYGLAIGEGVETILAARQLGFRPAWALGSAGAVRNFPVLSGIEALTILVDNDQPDARGRQAGQDAATQCWHRWTNAGREVLAFTSDKPDTDIATVIERGAHHG
jgi:hypothetical protein